MLARALLGEWLGGSGGGWQDSGGVWPGMKLIAGAVAGGRRSRIRHQPRPPDAHPPCVFDGADVRPDARQTLQDSLVLVHGGMAQNVGPILEMVTEKYLLRCESGMDGAPGNARACLDEILDSLPAGDIRAIGEPPPTISASPIQTIIPWASNLYTETAH